MEYSKKEFSILSGIKKGRPLPQWYLDEPEVYPADYFYIKSFDDLNTCRSFGMSIGPIPWRDIIEYAHYQNLEDNFIDHFVSIIRIMDNAYIKQVTKDQEK